jgi:hypothetical protein
LSELHIEPVVDSQDIGVFRFALGYLVVPKRGQIQHFFFFYRYVVALSLLQLFKSLEIFLKVRIHANPFVGPICWNALEGRLFSSTQIAPFRRFKLLLFEEENRMGRHQSEVLFPNQTQVEVFVGVFVER